MKTYQLTFATIILTIFFASFAHAGPFEKTPEKMDEKIKKA